MARSPKTTPQPKSASQTGKKVKIQTKAQAKAQADKQSTAKSGLSLSWVTLTAQQTEMLQKLQESLEQLCPGIPQEEIMEFLQENHFEEMPEEFLPNVIAALPKLANCPSFEELYANYQDFSDLLQDFQTLLENRVAKFRKDFDNDLRSDHPLASKYIDKLLTLQIFIAYVDKLLKYAGEFTGDTSKYKVKLKRTKLNRDIPVIYANYDIEQPDPEYILRYFDYGMKSIFVDIQDMVDPSDCALSPASYQNYLKEVQDSVSNFVLTRAQAILDLNDKYVTTPFDANDLNGLLNLLNVADIEDPAHKWAQPFELFLSDDDFHSLPCTEDVMLIFTDILKIQLKYSLPKLHQWCTITFMQSCHWYEIEPEQFIAQMNKIREQRIKASRKKQVKRVTFTLQQPQE